MAWQVIQTLFHSFWDQERSLCELPSRVIPTQGYRKTGEWTRETVLQHAVCKIGHGLLGRDPLRRHWNALGVIVIVIVIVR